MTGKSLAVYARAITKAHAASTAVTGVITNRSGLLREMAFKKIPDSYDAADAQAFREDLVLSAPYVLAVRRP